MTTSLTEETPGTVPVKGRKKWLRVVLWSLLSLLLILLTGAVVLAASLFSPPKNIPLQPLTTQDLILQQKLFRRLSQEIFGQKRKKEFVLVLKASELQSLFRLIDYGFSAAKLAGKYAGTEPRYFEPVFGPGRLRIVYPQNTGYSWLFGGVLRWQITATPELKNNILTVDIHDCRIGSVPLPRSTAEQIMQEILVQLHSSEEYSIFCRIIKKLYLKKDGSLVVICSPHRLLNLLRF